MCVYASVDRQVDRQTDRNGLMVRQYCCLLYQDCPPATNVFFTIELQGAPNYHIWKWAVGVEWAVETRPVILTPCVEETARNSSWSPMCLQYQTAADSVLLLGGSPC